MFLKRARVFGSSKSSVIQTIAYISDWKERNLFVTFTSGATYKYSDVPFKKYKSLARVNNSSESLGSVFNDIIKGSFYAYTRIVWAFHYLSAMNVAMNTHQRRTTKKFATIVPIRL